MNLGEFHALVSRETTMAPHFDLEIPSYVKRAARFIERNQDMEYMRKYVEFTLNAAASQPRSIPFFNNRVKDFIFFRYPITQGWPPGYENPVSTEGSWFYLTQVDPRDVAGNADGPPSAYWLDGRDCIWFDNKPGTDIDMQASWYEYTDWPTDPASEPWLVTDMEDLLLGQTMMFLSPRAREPEWIGLYRPQRDEGLRTLHLAEEQLRQSNRDEFMVYQG